jgi:hypothetical protein
MSISGIYGVMCSWIDRTSETLEASLLKKSLCGFQSFSQTNLAFQLNPLLPSFLILDRTPPCNKMLYMSNLESCRKNGYGR